LLLGVISGYDLLALEATPGRMDDSIGFFPPVDRCGGWSRLNPLLA